MRLQEIMLAHNKDFIKFMYITDTHFNATTPKNRKDNLLETGLYKLDEAVEIANNNEVDFVLHGGDFFEKPDVTDLVAGRVAKRIRKFKMPVMVVPGGHDLFGNNIESIKRTKLGFFNQSGLVKLLIHPDKDNIIVKNKNLSVQLTGTASHYGIDNENIDEDYVLKYKNADFAIHTIHGMLMPKPFIPNTPTVLIDDIIDTKADLTLAGHYHIGFDPVNINGKLFCNCGAMVRKKNDIKEMNRMPKVVIITISKAKGIEMQFIELKTAKPGDEVLDRTEIEKRQQRAIKVQGFLGQIKQAQNIKTLNINTIVQEISKNKKLPQEVVKLSLDRVSKIQELLETGKPLQFLSANGQMKYIKRIIIKNFQSHEDTVIDLENGINVLLGESNQGKSAIIRALKWVLYNEPKGNDFIKRGTNECSVTIIMSDGYEVTRTRKKIKNSYIVKDPAGNELMFENFNNNIPTEVLEATGVMKIQIDADKELALNLNEQLDPPFLLSETGSIKAKAVGCIVKTNILDATERDIQKDITSTNSELKDIEAQIKDTDIQLEQYADIDNSEKALKRMGELIEKLKTISASVEKLQYLRGKISNTETEISKNKEVLLQLTNLPHLELMYMDLNGRYKTHKQVVNLKTKIETRDKEIDNNAQILSKLKNIKSLEDKVKRLDALYETEKKVQEKVNSIKNIEGEILRQENIVTKLQVLPHLESKVRELDGTYQVEKRLAEKKISIEALNKDIEIERAIIGKLKQLPELENKYARLKQLRNASARLAPIIVKYTDIEKGISVGKEFMVQNENNLEHCVNTYVENLKLIGKCPTCTHVITDKEIKKIAKELKGES